MTQSKSSPVIFVLIGFVVGLAIAIVGFSVWQERPSTADDHVLVAEGFRNITYINGKFNIEVVSRIDDSNLEVAKTLEMPTSGFLKGYTAMENLVDELIKAGIVKGKESVTDPPE